MWATGRRDDLQGGAGPRPGTGAASGGSLASGIGGKEMFVYATLEPSIAAYHLAFNDEGTLFVTGPTTSSNQSVYAIDRDGHTSVYYQGLGRAQGIALDVDGNLYVAASLRGAARDCADYAAAGGFAGGFREQPGGAGVSGGWMRGAGDQGMRCTMWRWILREGSWCNAEQHKQIPPLRCGDDKRTL